MGIKVTTKTKAKATLKLANTIRSYLFEQEYGELNNHILVKKELKEVLNSLDNLIKESK